MEIIIEELNTHQQFLDMLDLQDKIWHLSDRDKLSPITLRSLSMEYPLMGLSLGAYYKDDIVGFVVCIPSRLPNTIFGLMMGVLPEFEGKNISDKLVGKVIKFCIEKNITKICWTFEPLDRKLAYFYIEKYGAIVVKYLSDYYQVDDEINKGLPIDRFIADINPLSQRICERINRTTSEKTISEIINKNPIVTIDEMPTNSSVLIEIPENYQIIKKTKPDIANKYRMDTRKLFDEYLNNREYFISDFISATVDDGRRYFYLLEKKGFL